MWYEDAVRRSSAAGARGHLVAASDRRLDSPAGPKGRRKLPQVCGQAAQGTRKTENPSPVSDFVRHPYILRNLGQRDEPSPQSSTSVQTYGLKRRKQGPQQR